MSLEDVVEDEELDAVVTSEVENAWLLIEDELELSTVDGDVVVTLELKETRLVAVNVAFEVKEVVAFGGETLNEKVPELPPLFPSPAKMAVIVTGDVSVEGV